MDTFFELSQEELMQACKFAAFNKWLVEHDWINYVNEEIYIHIFSHRTNHVKDLWSEYYRTNVPENY